MILSRLDKKILAGCGVLVMLAIATWTLPRALVERARSQALSCLDDAREPVDAARCDPVEADLAGLARVPWVKHDATYRYEELRARRALAAYDEAAFLSPSAAGLEPAAASVGREQDVVEHGSERLTLDELGVTVAAPDAAAAAAFRGDRASLRKRYDHVGLWSVRLAALEAAIFDGEMELADKIAARYAEFDPRDADLRSAVGAVLCLGPDPGRGLEILARIPGDRAEKRYAAIARPYGEVRAVQEACADLAAIEPPPMPIDRHAGLPDATEARAVQALRLAKGEIETAEAREAIRALLTGDAAPSGPGLDTSIPGARASLLAELVVSDVKIKPADVAALARPRTGAEPPLVDDVALDVVDVLRDPRGPTPYVPPSTFEQAAERVRKMSTEKDPPAAVADLLESTARAFDVHAALGFARAGDAERARAAAQRAGSGDPHPLRATALLASALVAAGAFAEARTVIGDAHPTWKVAIPAPTRTNAREVAEAKSSARDLYALAFDEVVAASALRRRDEARASSERARELAEATGEPALVSRARVAWLAAAEPGEGDGDPLLRAMGGTELDRRSARRATFAARGGAPLALAPYAIALGRLAPSGAAEADVETWLDAALALDARRFSMREVALARLVAARSRGHEGAAKAWAQRLAALRAPFADPRRAVVARFLGM